jgi:hypothetical protein
MSWTCPYQIGDECVRLKKVCHPLQKGCVLDGKVTFVGKGEHHNNVNQKGISFNLRPVQSGTNEPAEVRIPNTEQKNVE